MNTPSNGKKLPGDDDKKDMFGRKLPQRFYKKAEVVESPYGFTVELDGRSIKTPAKNLMEVESEAVAAAIAADWQRQAEFIDLETMYTAKVANTAIDRIAPNPDEVIAEITDYAGSDLLCYRALEPVSLLECQNDNWDPVLKWIDTTHQCRLVCIGGVMHRPQPVEAMVKLAANLRTRSAIMLAAMHNMTTLTGSAVLAFAVADGYLNAQKAWACAHVDEDWQSEQWGHDEDAAAHRARRWLEMEKTATLLSIL
jgi:chaperone required for assembly of F1-ATPase